MTQTLTDEEALASQVATVFDDLKCIIVTGPEHEGSPAAWYEVHDCHEGWICEAHLQYFHEVLVPTNLEMIEKHGYIYCGDCLRQFSDLSLYFSVLTIHKGSAQ
jgi:hypothetical protein